MRTSEELREKLFQTIDDLRAGKIKPAEANAIVACSREIISSVRVEIDVASYREAYPKSAPAVPPALMLTETE